MPKQIPFLYRRGDVYTFRIAVPLELRPYTRCRELTKSLRTTSKQIALPRAFELAATCKRLFFDLREIMSDSYPDSKLDMPTRMRLEAERIQLRWAKEEHEAEIKRLQDMMLQERKVHNAKLEAYKEILDNSKPANVNLGQPQHAGLSHGYQETNNNVVGTSHKLSIVIDSFLAGYSKDKHPAMYKKHQTCLPMFLKVIGDKPISEIKQLDIKGFFSLLESLPPRWSDECRKRKIGISELAKKFKHTETISPKTFKSTYIASIRSFLISAKSDWQDQGFPTTLSTDGIEYHGTRLEGENSQRAIKPSELLELFGSEKMINFANNEREVHKYWLPLIGLYTGARVNEICQINPQSDVLKEPDTQIWYFWITDITDGDERIEKRTKNEVSKRKVPIHTALLERGILSYIDSVKQQGHKLLLPGFKPLRGKASGNAEKWFTEYLKETNLRDDTPHEKFTGMHAFRSTFSNAAMNAGVDESSIIGHAHNVNEEQSSASASRSSKVKRKYRGELSLLNKQSIIEKVVFDSVPLVMGAY